jgi:hypothetical protein
MGRRGVPRRSASKAHARAHAYRRALPFGGLNAEGGSFCRRACGAPVLAGGVLLGKLPGKLPTTQRCAIASSWRTAGSMTSRSESGETWAHRHKCCLASSAARGTADCNCVWRPCTVAAGELRTKYDVMQQLLSGVRLRKGPAPLQVPEFWGFLSRNSGFDTPVGTSHGHVCL